MKHSQAAQRKICPKSIVPGHPAKKRLFFPLQNKWTLLNQLYSRLLPLLLFSCSVFPVCPPPSASRPLPWFPRGQDPCPFHLYIHHGFEQYLAHERFNKPWLNFTKDKVIHVAYKFSVCLLGWVIKQFIFICQTFSHPNVLYFLLGQPPCQFRNTRNSQVPLNSPDSELLAQFSPFFLTDQYLYIWTVVSHYKRDRLLIYLIFKEKFTLFINFFSQILCEFLFSRNIWAKIP